MMTSLAQYLKKITEIRIKEFLDDNWLKEVTEHSFTILGELWDF